MGQRSKSRGTSLPNRDNVRLRTRVRELQISTGKCGIRDREIKIVQNNNSLSSAYLQDYRDDSAYAYYIFISISRLLQHAYINVEVLRRIVFFRMSNERPSSIATKI